MKLRGSLTYPFLRGSNNATLWWFWRISVWWNELLRDMTGTGDFANPSTVWKRPWRKAVGVFFAERSWDVWCNFWNDFWIDGSRLSLGYGIGCLFFVNSIWNSSTFCSFQFKSSIATGSSTGLPWWCENPPLTALNRVIVRSDPWKMGDAAIICA